MKKIIALALAAGMTVSVASAAQAREGCGPGGHRGPYGHCRPNRGEYGMHRGYGMRHPVLVVDRYYAGRGYWDGHRYWHHRERGDNGWRYR